MDYFVLVKLVLAILLLLGLVMKKKSPQFAMVVASIFLMIICGQGPKEFAALFATYLKTKNVYTMSATILLISVLSNVMNRTGIMNKMVDNLQKTVNSTRVTLMITPMLIGLLTMVGGAFMSCPLVDAIAKDSDVPPRRLAAINLVYRHAVHFMYPLSSTFYMTVALIGCTNAQLMSVTFPLSVCMFLSGYFCFIKDIKENPALMGSGNKAASFGKFLKYISPILVTLGLTVFFNLLMPLAVAAGVCTAILISYTEEDTKPKDKLTKIMFEGIKMKTVYVILAALFFKAVINHITAIGTALKGLAETGMPPELIVILICALTALPTGSNATAASIAIPIAVTFAQTPGQVLMYAALCMAGGYQAYFFSPVHMCQLLTIEYFKTDLSALLKEYKYFMPIQIAFTAVWYLVLKFVVFV